MTIDVTDAAARERERQEALERLDLLDQPADERVDRVTRLAREVFGVPMVSVTLLDDDRQWRLSEQGFEGEREAPRAGSFCGAAVAKGSMLIVEDAASDEDFSTNPFVTGDPHLRFYAGQPLEAPGGEQIGTLCILDTKPRRLTGAQRELLQEMALWVQTEIARGHELDRAGEVQRALLPRHTPAVPGFTLAADALPAGQVMGDLYDWYIHDGRLRFTLADVMGKGIGAGLIAAGVRASLRTARERPLVEAVGDLDRQVSEDLADIHMFVTAVIAEVDAASGEVELVDAGHSLAFIVRSDDTWEPIRSTGLPLGMGIDESRESTRVRLGPGDALLCCSDGVLDILDDDDPFGQVLRALRHGGPSGAVAEGIALAKARKAPDDVTLMVVRRDA
ncbi:SpoIIE family protein phosphatase [Microbacterium sp. EYE_5]|uniref:PP2C family protein-serine/threonine phosphatase n=1 Tax=unclassified Microbacterium TaxID=2609290 RepID=UPI00200464FE|nr:MULTISPECIES: GAF domain-containing SpoIIE family protein phosphatase [unclassified Microbacterium]MCK6081706.1 SpoIIE family protein phosphatase [Microbacterium sp. EYE_382]MCK6086976.1 SpoIIE family protein phosphatase [Microbacterium sp. EYE_384]MCK6123526.1 SpoIIE family protein phosphatase [Microbacterium sp. EYE_80]MCK6126435.1 SpoIIE family protein phosphatase [Microbacterium sp. EYE_79]MCK6142660.1 SpoIIE family protein phosphatase [Microbacterium sp. EYE_39]